MTERDDEQFERYLRGFFDLLTVSFVGRYRYRPLHLFGSMGLLLGAIGIGLLAYLTVDKILGHPIGQRPLLFLGVLVTVVGIQLLGIGLLAELVLNQHEERTGERAARERHVEEILA